MVLVIFSAARKIAIFGKNSATNWALGICIVICIVASVSFSRDPASYLSGWSETIAPTVRADAPAKLRDDAQRNLARYHFVQQGEIISYVRSTGESIRFEPTARDIADRDNIVTETATLEAARRAHRERQLIWLFAWIPVLVAGYFAGRIEYAYLVKKYQFSRIVKPQTFAEIEGFVGLLKGACEDPKMNSTLELILAQPDSGRKAMIKNLLGRFRDTGAPQILTDAFLCLMDDDVAEKVYVFIHKCERPVG